MLSSLPCHIHKCSGSINHVLAKMGDIIVVSDLQGALITEHFSSKMSSPQIAGTSSSRHTGARLKWGQVLQFASEAALDGHGMAFKAHQVVAPCAVRLQQSVLLKLGFKVQRHQGCGYVYLQVGDDSVFML